MSDHLKEITGRRGYLTLNSPDGRVHKIITNNRNKTGQNFSFYTELSFLTLLKDAKNIVHYEDFKYSESTLDITMKQYDYDGTTFFNEFYPKPFIKKFIYKVLIAIYEMKKKLIIHCDLKPNNILINHVSETDDIDVCLIDFDISIFNTIKFNIHPAMIETYGYRSPEICKEINNLCVETDLILKIGEKVDIWALGVIIVTCLIPYHIKIDNYYPRKFPKNMSEDLFNYDKFFIEIERKNTYGWVNDSDLNDLIKNMLEYEYEKRFSVEDALQHRYFSEFYKLSPLSPTLLFPKMSRFSAICKHLNFNIEKLDGLKKYYYEVDLENFFKILWNTNKKYPLIIDVVLKNYLIKVLKKRENTEICLSCEKEVILKSCLCLVIKRFYTNYDCLKHFNDNDINDEISYVEFQIFKKILDSNLFHITDYEIVSVLYYENFIDVDDYNYIMRSIERNICVVDLFELNPLIKVLNKLYFHMIVTKKSVNIDSSNKYNKIYETIKETLKNEPKNFINEHLYKYYEC